MSGSNREVQELADQILELLGARLRAGQLVVHYSDGLVQRCEVNNVYKAHRQRSPETSDEGGRT